jgi:DNA-binding transcriptional regulator PaaX
MRVKSTDVMKAILTAVEIAGILTIAIAAPNLIGAFGAFSRPARRFKPRQLKQSLDYARHNNLIMMGKEGDKTTIRLTKEGQQRLLKYKVEDMKLFKPNRWDKKWRLVFSDIPEKYKTNRDVFSQKLKEIGFMPLQKSVWIWPYECSDEVDFLKELYEVRPFVRIATADKLDREQELIQHFGLGPI